MRLSRCCLLIAVCLLAALFSASPAHASGIELPAEASRVLDKIYSFELDAAVEAAKKLQDQQPDHPLGYLLEGEAIWWRIWCASADFKWGMVDARHRSKFPADQHYFELAAKAYSVALARIRQSDSAEMEFYAGMADALAARLYGLRGENRATARAGVRARQSFLRALQLDPQFADADFGLGLYNYYVDTLSAFAKMLRFFMGIPGGSKQEGLRQLQRAISSGALTPTIARIYLALNLHRYDEQYARAIQFLAPVVERYPSNPLLQLMLGDLHAKLGHKDRALLHYEAAAALPVSDAECRSRIQALAESASTSLKSAKPARSN
jgi:tetratricopeptide (TPR) repeat protein